MAAVESPMARGIVDLRHREFKPDGEIPNPGDLLRHFPANLLLARGLADKDKNKNSDTLAAAWPESEMFNQILDRLNQWVRLNRAGDWKPDGLVETLPELFKELPMVKALGSREFSPSTDIPCSRPLIFATSRFGPGRRPGRFIAGEKPL